MLCINTTIEKLRDLHGSSCLIVETSEQEVDIIMNANFKDVKDLVSCTLDEYKKVFHEEESLMFAC
jgi:hypothetical protein